VDESALRLLVSRDEATALLAAQITAGENLRNVVACATATADLVPIKAEMAAWSARNEAALVKVFGNSAGLRYRLDCRGGQGS